MAVLDRNDFFYTALRVAVAQDKNPDWIFKTNLLHIDNISQKIYSDNLIRPAINLTSIYDYLERETPFHVHFDNFAIQYTKNDEIANVQLEDEHTFRIEISHHNVTEYPTTLGYDNLQYDFEYPGIGNNGTDYNEYVPNYGNIKLHDAGWYAFGSAPLEEDPENPCHYKPVDEWPYIDPETGESTRNSCVRGSLEEDPICALYDYSPNSTEFNYVLSTYNRHYNTNLTKTELTTLYYKDPYFFENSANYLYILNQNKTFDWVRERLHNNFQGLIVEGGKNGADDNGYESDRYDDNLYDYITYENKYFITSNEKPDWFLEEEDRYNINKVLPVETTRFYTPVAPFATKKLNVYLDEYEKVSNFNLFGKAYFEEDWLKNYNNDISYAAFKNAFNVYNNAWEISVVIDINKFEPVVVNQTDRYVNKLISILGSTYNKYSIPQLYIIKDTVFLDVSTNGKEYDVRLYQKGLMCGETYTITIGYNNTNTAETPHYYLTVNGLLNEENNEQGEEEPEKISVKANYNEVIVYKGDIVSEQTMLKRGFINKSIIINQDNYVPIYKDPNFTEILLYVKTLEGNLAEPDTDDPVIKQGLYYFDIEVLKKDITDYVTFVDKPYHEVKLYYPNENPYNIDYSQFITGYIAEADHISNEEYSIIYSDKKLTNVLAKVKSYSEGDLYITEAQKIAGVAGVTSMGEYYIPADITKTYSVLTYMENTREFENNRFSYINTNYYLNQDSRVKIKFSALSSDNNNVYVGLFGSVITTLSEEKGLGIYTHFLENKIKVVYNDKSYDISVDNIASVHTIDINKNSIYLDNELLYSFDYEAFDMEEFSALLFGVKQQNLTNYGKYKIYECKIYDNDELVQDLVPVLRSTDESLGFYNRVNENYILRQGTGDLIAGELTGEIIYIEEDSDIIKCFIDRERIGLVEYAGMLSRKVLYKEEEIYTPKEEIPKTNSRNPIFYDSQAVLRLGDSTYRKDLVNYIPYHYIGGIFDYPQGLPKYDEDNDIIFVPALTVVFPISKNSLVKMTVDNLSDLPEKANDGVIVAVRETNKKYIYFNGKWTEYKDSEYIQQLGIKDLQGNVIIMSYYTAAQLSSTEETDGDAILIKNVTTSSNIDIPEELDSENPGLLIYSLYGINLILASYVGKYSNNPTDIYKFPAYYFNVTTDSFFYKENENSTWVEQYDFTILGRVSRSTTGNISVQVFPTFEQSTDIRFLYQDSNIDIDRFEFKITSPVKNNIGQIIRYESHDMLTVANKYKTLKLNRDYTIGVDDDSKEYIEILDNNLKPRQLKENSVLQIDCLDYDYLYDIIYGNKANKDNEFTRYKSYLGRYSSLEDMVAKNGGSIKVKYHDYFLNTSTPVDGVPGGEPSIWVFEYADNQWDVLLDLDTQDIEITITESNLENAIFEVLGFEFGWVNTNKPYGYIQEQDLAVLRGTRLLRPEHTAKGSEELRTTVHDDVIIDVVEDSSYLNIDELKIAPSVISENFVKGKNQEIAGEVMVNDAIITFEHGKYVDTPILWRDHTGLMKYPDYQLKPMLDVTYDQFKAIEIDEDHLEIEFTRFLYNETRRVFTVVVDSYIDTNVIILTFDGKILEEGSDYYLKKEGSELEFTITNESLFEEDMTYCYGIFVLKSDTYTVTHKVEVPSVPFEIPLRSDYVNVSIFNSIMLFNEDNVRIPEPYMKWYYVEKASDTFELPTKDLSNVIEEKVGVYIGVGHNVKRLMKVDPSEYTFIDGNIKFVANIPVGLTVCVVLPTFDSYNLRFTYNNGRRIIDYKINYIVNEIMGQEPWFIVDYGSDEGDGEGTVAVITERDLNVKFLIYNDYPNKFNWRLDVYQRREDDTYTINSDIFDKKSLNVWRNGLLLQDNEYKLIDNKVYLYTNNNNVSDIIHIWYKINQSIKSKEHNKIIISDTNKIYNLMDLPEVKTFLLKDFTDADVKMYVSGANYLTQPNVDLNNYSQCHPGRIQIGNEIIEFWNVNLYDLLPGTETRCHSLSGFVRGIRNTDTVSRRYSINTLYTKGTGIQDIGQRFETLVSNTKNKDSLVNYATVNENWAHKVDDERNEWPNPRYDEAGNRVRYSLMPWYNIPGDMNKETDITVWKTEQFSVVEDYVPSSEEVNIIKLSNDKNVQKISDYIYTSTIGGYTYDVNRLVRFENLYYRSHFINDTINIELYNDIEVLRYADIKISGTMEQVANAINNAVDQTVLHCVPVYDDLEDVEYMVFNLKNGYSMRIVENNDSDSFFIQELFGGIEKSTNGDVVTAANDLVVYQAPAINPDTGMREVDDKNAFILTVPATGFEKYYELREPTGGATTLELLINDINADFAFHHVWLNVKVNPEIGNITQLNIVNYNRTEIILEDFGTTDNFAVLGITGEVRGCPIISLENENGEMVITNNHVGHVVINDKHLTFTSTKYEGDVIALIGINLEDEIKAGEVFMGANFIEQKLNDDYYIEYEAVKFYERLPIGTLIRIQNRDMIVNANANYLHSHILTE